MRPTRPDSWAFAMDFLGEPESAEIEAYVSALEAWTDAAVAAERERCAKVCESYAEWLAESEDFQRQAWAARQSAKRIREAPNPC